MGREAIYINLVLAYVMDHPGARRHEICRDIGCSYNTLNTILWRLRQEDLLEMPNRGTWGRCYIKGQSREPKE